MSTQESMKAFVKASSEYLKHPNENTASILQHNLGMISNTDTPTIFKPNTTIATKFYLSLHELMNGLESRSTLFWSALEVLQSACKNPAAKKALMHTYKFVPILTRILETNLTSEKKIQVLKLLQELTYGVKSAWQEAHFPYLISSLIKWLMQTKEGVILERSLGVLVNLCHKNLPAVHTLMKSVDRKTFIGALLRLHDSNVGTKVYCCKMMFILNEHGAQDMDEKTTLDCVTVMFNSILPAMQSRDVLLLRHIFDFFDDLRDQHLRGKMLSYTCYTEYVDEVLSAIGPGSDPECISLLMEFLLSLVKLQVADLVPLYPRYVKSAMDCVPIQQVCSKALALIRAVVIEARKTNFYTKVLSNLDFSILIGLVRTDQNNPEGNADDKGIEAQGNISELMQLLQELVRMDEVRARVMEVFSANDMRRILRPIADRERLTDESVDHQKHLFEDTAPTLYIHALALTAELASHNRIWLTFYSEVLRFKSIKTVMALGLYTGDRGIKNKVLRLLSSPNTSEECASAVAARMEELSSLLLVQTNLVGMNPVFQEKSPVSTVASGYMMPPHFSLAQKERLDAVIEKLKQAFDAGRIGDVTTSAMMELYDYKLETMRLEEKAKQASLEAADNRVTSLQHKQAQIVAECSRLHQLLFTAQQSLEGAQKEKDSLRTTLQELKSQTEKTHATLKQEIRSLKKIVEDKSMKIEEQTNDIQKLSRKLKDAMETLTSKDQELALKRVEIEALQEENRHLTEQCYNHQKSLEDKDRSIGQMREELRELALLRDTIFELTAKRKKDDQSG